MLKTFIPLLLAGSAFIASFAAAEPTINLVVPSYDYTPGHATYTISQGIANDGSITGAYTSRTVQEAGYVRLASGHFSQPIIFPGGNFTSAFGINSSGLVCGTFITNATHAFFFDGTTYTQFDWPGNANSYVFGLNDAGDFVGLGIDAGGGRTAYLSVGGVVSSFSIPGATETDPRAINNLGQVAGYYLIGSLQQGFLRDADGTLHYPIDFPGATNTGITGLNDRGYMVGTYNSGGPEHGFVILGGSRTISYDYPTASETFFAGINNRNTICGFYTDSAHKFNHAFVAALGR